jgi:hypothetical protein
MDVQFMRITFNTSLTVASISHPQLRGSCALAAGALAAIAVETGGAAL